MSVFNELGSRYDDDYYKKVERFVLPYAGGGGTQQSFIRFYMKRLRPVVQTLTLLYIIFDRKGTPFAYHPQKIELSPFIYLRSDFY